MVMGAPAWRDLIMSWRGILSGPYGHLEPINAPFWLPLFESVPLSLSVPDTDLISV